MTTQPNDVQIKRINGNVHEVTYDQVTILVSYNTPVAFVGAARIVRETTTQWSASTKRQIEQFKRRLAGPKKLGPNDKLEFLPVFSVEQSWIDDKLFDLIGSTRLDKRLQSQDHVIDTTRVNYEDFTASGNANMVVPVTRRY